MILFSTKNTKFAAARPHDGSGTRSVTWRQSSRWVWSSHVKATKSDHLPHIVATPIKICKLYLKKSKNGKATVQSTRRAINMFRGAWPRPSECFARSSCPSLGMG